MSPVMYPGLSEVPFYVSILDQKIFFDQFDAKKTFAFVCTHFLTL